ncbi:MAG: PAS domain S-box protein [Thermoanaerobaculia bacterium]|nr:PAS domain S-box protein [Thermoanaerobaculia bacterium]
MHDSIPENARYRAMVEHSSDILSVVRGDGTFDYVSPTIQRILGHEPADLVGRCIYDYVHEDDRDRLEEILGRPGEHPLEARFQTTSDDWVVLEAVASRPAEDSGVTGLVLNARDVTEKHRAQERLQESEERYRTLFEHSRDAILIGALGGELWDVNPAAVKLFRYGSKAELMTANIESDLYWNPEDRRRVVERFKRQGYVDDVELELRTKDGKRLRVKESATAIHGEDGAIIGFRGILRDVTEQRRLQEQLREAQKMDAVGRLAGGVAHDFNNLLTAINGYSELTLARMDDGDPMRQPIEEIRKAGKRATDLTRRLRILSRHQVVSPRKLSLNQCVNDMQKLLERVIGEDIQLRTMLDAELPEIYADQGQLEQIILNLVVNARDAMPDGGVLEFETDTTLLSPEDGTPGLAPGEYVLLYVRDTGLGMERKVREHAFEPFFTTKGRGHNTGLGLSIVYGIVKQSGGHIEVESAEGEGSTFRLYFPVQGTQASALPESTTVPGQPLPAGDETILLVEDETSVRTLVRQILELQGYTVWAARNANAAEALCEDHGRRNQRPDLLLTDVVMPGRSGLALAEDLRQRFSGLKVLFISGYTDSHSGVELLTQQRAHFLPKPFSPDALARKVRDVLDE